MKKRSILPILCLVAFLAVIHPPAIHSTGDPTGQITNDAALVENVMHFAEGVAGICIKGKWGFIDAAGRWVIEPLYT